MSWYEVHRIQQLESQVRKLEDRLAELEARFSPPPLSAAELEALAEIEASSWRAERDE